MSFLECENEECRGKCKLPDWARAGTSNYANDIPGQQAYLARCHSWFKPPWTAGVIAYQRAKAALSPAAATFACSGCGRFAFPEPTTCLWCRRVGPVDELRAPAPELAQAAPNPLPRQTVDVDEKRPPARKRAHVDKSPPPEPGLFGPT